MIKAHYCLALSAAANGEGPAGGAAETGRGAGSAAELGGGRRGGGGERASDGHRQSESAAFTGSNTTVTVDPLEPPLL